MAGEEVVLVLVGVMAALAMVGVIGAYAARYKRVPPNHAMIVFGRRFQDGRNYSVFAGGGKFIFPIIESFRMISLEPFEIDLLIEDVVANVLGGEREGKRLQVSVDATASVSGERDRLNRAAGQLLQKSQKEIKRIVEQTLEGHTRGVLATETRLDHDLGRVAEKIRSAADADLAVMGIEVRSLVMRIRDAAALRRVESTDDGQLAREVHRLDIRMKRVEEKLGLSATP